MPFDKSKPFGESLGGVTHGWPVQDGVIWHPSGQYAVDADGKKLANQKTSAPAPAAVATPASAGPLAAELKE